MINICPKCAHMTKYFISLLLVTVLSQRAYCQRQRTVIVIDSLKTELNKQSADSNKVKLLKKIGENYNSVCSDSAIAYGYRSLQLADKTCWERGKAIAHLGLGVTYEQRSDLPNSLDHYLQALRINEHIGNKRGIAAGNWGIGNIYRQQKEYETAKQYTKKALKYYEEAGDKISVSSLMLNLGNCYNSLDQLDSAISLYRKALSMKQELGDIRSVSQILMCIGSIYLKQKDYGQCLSHYFQSLKIFEEIGDEYDNSSLMGNIGQCYLSIAQDSNKIKPDSLVSADRRTNLTTAVKFLDSALKISKTTGQINDARITALDLSEALELLGNYQQALAMYKEHVAYKDSIYSGENMDKIAELETKRGKELKDKDMQIAKLRMQIYTICILLLVVGISYIGYRLYLQVRSNRQLAKDRAEHLQKIDSQGKILEHITYRQSHDLRGNVATILGLAKLFNFEDATDPFNKEIIEHIDSLATKMDNVIIDVIKQENKLMKENKGK